MKTLLANLGNRNIHYKGEYLANYLKKNDKGKSIWEFSKEIYDDFEQQRQYLTVTILDEIINNNTDVIDKIVLFGSNQPETTRKSQDTIYIANIVKALLSDELTGVEIEVNELRCEITDNNQLLRTYKSFFKKRLEQNWEEQFIICDAGGTAQQKSSLKIIAEFLLKEKQYEVHYVSFDGNKSVWKPIPQVEYRNVITGEQIISLIAIGEYNSALNLNTNFTSGLELKGDNYLLAFAKYRIQMLVEDALSLIRRLPEHKRNQYPFLLNYLKKTSLSKNSGFQEVFKRKTDDFFISAELLTIAQFYWQIENCSQAVLFMSRFVERYVNGFINQKGYDLVNDYEAAFDKLIRNLRLTENRGTLKEIKSQIETLGINSSGNKLLKGVPLSLSYCSTYTDNESHNELMSLFFSLYKTNHLGALRNKLAHKGEGVKKRDVRSLKNIFTKIFNLYGIPEKNFYFHLNEIISNKL